jgi:hypothetical protein
VPVEHHASTCVDGHRTRESLVRRVAEEVSLAVDQVRLRRLPATLALADRERSSAHPAAPGVRGPW